MNVLGAFLGTRACLPLLRASGGGAIVNIGSIDSVQGSGADERVHRVEVRVARAHEGDGAREPEAGRPGQHRVPGARQSRDDPADRRVRFGRAGLPAAATPPDLSPVADAACYLASDESSLCSGTELVLDRGSSAGLALDLPDAWFDPIERG